MFAVIDIETTGGNMLNDRITEIAIILHNGHRIIEEYSTLINPLRPIQPFVAALTGITNEMVLDAPTFDEVADKIYDLTRNKIIVAHNASFDYGFLKSEYKRSGKRFRRKTLCTVKTSRKVFPHKQSYGLGNLCRDLEIEIYDRHRAHGDASATAILLEKLIFNDKKKIIKDLLNGELATTHLPEKITPEIVDELPEEIGVYYFLNEKGKIIYIGKSKNIRERVISHFRNDSNRSTPIKMKEQIHDITYEITGDELVALLLESDEIKRWMPVFNKAQRRQHYRYGLFVNEDQNGYLTFDINLLHPDRKELHKFRSKRRAEIFLGNLEKKSGFQPELKSTLTTEDYNKLVQKAIKKYQYPYERFLIIGHGRIEGEKSAILIEDSNYVGYGYFEPIMTGSDINAIVSCIKPFRNNQNTRSIILSYLRKSKKKSNLFPF